MLVIIVGQAHGAIGPLADLLTQEGFEVKALENSTAVVSFTKIASIQLLIADETLLVGLNFGKEILRRCPMARMVALSSKPSGLKMVETLADGFIDYFPLLPEVFPEIVRAMTQERDRLERWQQVFLTESRV